MSSKRQIGVVSFGADDCTSDKPSAYARITDNLDFINEVINDAAARAEMGGD